MFKGIFAAALCVVGLIAISGCASVTRGVDETMTFDSVPPGATMRSVYDTHCGTCMVDSVASAPAQDDPAPVPGPACITPCTIVVPRNKVLVATFTKEGFEPETVNIRWKVAGTGAAGFAGNVILGGAIGLAIDAGTGAALDHTPNPAVAILRPVTSRKSDPVIGSPRNKKKPAEASISNPS